MTTPLPDLPDDWTTALVVVAHPDDPEYGVGAAVAVWTAAGRDVRYLLAIRGEAGIAGLDPAESAVVREAEQRASAAAVGVQVVEFLDHADGTLVEGPALRRDVTAAIRRHRPQLVVTLNHHDTWPGAGSGGGGWNTADHRALGRSVLDAVADAGNEWIHRDLADGGVQPWSGVRWVAVAASPRPTHVVDVTGGVEAAVTSLAEHRRYLEALSDSPVPDQARAVVEMSTSASAATGGRRAVTVELFG